MRVLHIYSGNLYGGIERMLVTFARTQPEVPELEHEFALAFPGRLAAELTAASAPVHQLGTVRASRPHTILSARRTLRSILASGKYDGAICHGPWPHALFAKTVRNSGTPLAFWKHSPFGGRHWTERWARRTKPDVVICNSNYTRDSVPRFWPPVPHRVIYCPVADRPDEADGSARAEIRTQWNTPVDAAVIVQVSRMEEWKGHDLLLTALTRLAERHDWHCWLVGGAQRAQEREYVRELERRAHSYGLSDRVHFLGERSDIPSLLNAADIFCQPNRTAEPFGIALVEAMYARLPVVTSRLGGAAEIVDETCGVLTTPADSGELAEALQSLLDDPDRRAKLGAAGPERARKISEPVRQANSLSNALKKFLAPRS